MAVPRSANTGLVYILRSGRNGRFYIGHTTNLPQRLAAHNRGAVRATRHLLPWSLVYVEDHASASDARKREWYLKRLKSRRFLENLISKSQGLPAAGAR